MTKARLRTEAKARRRAFVAAMTPADRCAAAVLLAARVEAELHDARCVAAYLPIGSEIDTLAIIDRLVRQGITIALPHVTGRSGTIRFLAWAPGDALPAGPMGIRQPDAGAPERSPDLILTPLLAFDARLNRLGYGAGHYDRALATHPAARRIGLGWSVQQVAAIDTDAWDMPLHGIATEKDWISA